MKFKYCPLCGKELELRDSWDEGLVPYCSFDDKMFFDVPKPCVVVAVIKGDQLLLLKQSYIFKNSKVLVSGYVSIDETVEQTVIREVKEEIGIKINEIKYLGSDFVENRELLMLTFMANYIDGEIDKSAEVEWAEWCDIKSALDNMTEDKIGTKVVKKVIKILSM